MLGICDTESRGYVTLYIDDSAMGTVEHTMMMDQVTSPPPDSDGASTTTMPIATTRAPAYWNLLYSAFSMYLDRIMLTGIAA